LKCNRATKKNTSSNNPLSFRIIEPADGNLCTRDFANVTFDAQGTTSSSSNPQRLDITSGTFQATDNSSTGQTLYSGNINGGNFNNNTSGGSLSIGSEVHRVPDKAHNCPRLDDILATTTYTAVQQIPIGL